MKMNKSGKILSVVLALMLFATLMFAVSVTASADGANNPTTANEEFFDLSQTFTYYQTCGRVRISWHEVPGASAYIVYLNDIHKGYTDKTGYNIRLETVDFDQALKYSTVTICAIDDYDQVITSGTITIAAEHSYTPKTVLPACTTWGYTENICTCGYSYIIPESYVEPLGHDLSEPNCVDPYVCQRTGCDYTEGEALGHIWGEWVSNGDDTHTRLCTRYEDLGVFHEETESCEGGLATCQNKAVCGVCNSEYGQLDFDSHTSARAWTTVTEATHASTYPCCGTVAIHEEDHEWSGGVCTECAYVCAHSGGVATCLDLAICEYCSLSYGEINPDNHTGFTYWSIRSEDIHESRYTCCDALTLSAEHDWVADPDTEIVTCTVCSMTQHTHVGGVATCISRPTCELCGLQYGYVNPHNHSGTAQWTRDESHHEARYSCCGVASVISETHNWTGGVCADCSYRCTHVAEPDDANCTTPVLCTKCSFIMVQAHTDHTAENDDGDCTTALRCSCEGCAVILVEAKANHEGGTATCSSLAQCKHCGTSYGDPLTHDWKTSVIAPTCENDGYTLHTCTKCNSQITENVVPAFGHNMTIKVPGIVATCTNEGREEYYQCSTCGYYVKIVTIPKLPHTYENKETEALDTTFFLHTYKECTECNHITDYNFSRINMQCSTVKTVFTILIIALAVIILAIIGIYALAPTTTPGHTVLTVVLTAVIGTGLILFAYIMLSECGQFIYNLFG